MNCGYNPIAVVDCSPGLLRILSVINPGFVFSAIRIILLICLAGRNYRSAKYPCCVNSGSKANTS